MSLTRTLSFVVAILVSPVLASAADDKSTCLTAYSNAQDLRSSSKLVEASRELRTCARAACPAFVARDCSRWLDEVEAATPSVVFAATLDGHDVTDVAVSVDDVALVERLDGTAVPLDPGPHDIEFRYASLRPLRQQVLVRTGEKNRAVEVAFATSQPVTVLVEPPPVAREVPTRPPMREHLVLNPWRPIGIAVGSTGVALIVASGAAALAAVVTKSDHCVANTCDPGTVGTLRDQTTFATATLIAGVALAAVGVTVAVLAKPRHAVLSSAADFVVIRF